MSLGEKVGILTGRGQLVANTTGATSSAPSIGFPGLTLQGGHMFLKRGMMGANVYQMDRSVHVRYPITLHFRLG